MLQTTPLRKFQNDSLRRSPPLTTTARCAQDPVVPKDSVSTRRIFRANPTRESRPSRVGPFLMKNLFSLFVLVGVILAGFYFVKNIKPNNFNQLKDGQTVTVTIGQNKIEATAAVSPAKRQQGLSNVSTLGDNSGMLFVFEQPGLHSFWMKDTLVPLDIVWISNNKIVDIQTMPVEGNPENPTMSYLPKSPANSALEVPAGAAKNWQIGQSVSITR